MFLYDETIHVPLLFKLPQQKSAGRQIELRTGLVDVMPTILQTVGIAIPKEMQGESLLPMIGSAAKPPVGSASPKPSPVAASVARDRQIYSESDYPHRTFGWSSLRSLRTGKYLFIEAPTKELYDQGTDPKSEHNLAPNSVAVADTLNSQLDAFRQKTTTSKEAPKVVADPGLQERLNALGYVAGDSTSSAMPGIKETGADPKNKVEVVNLLHRAEMLKEDMYFAEAVPLLEQVIALEPALPITYLQLGTALTSLKDYDKAVPVLRKAVEMRPDLTVPRYQLGSALFETGDFPGAASEFEIAIARSPNWAEAHLSLATAYARENRLQDAIAEYEKVIELRPNHYSAHLLMGRAMALSGNPNGALPLLMRAVELQPKSPEPHRFLADAYVQLGQQSDADRERAAAQRLRAAGGQ
jgi:tetratricopeptide (TPR) repeat protein